MNIMTKQPEQLMNVGNVGGGIKRTVSLADIQENADVLARRARIARRIFIALGVVILAYIYADRLLAQQASQQRISIIQAATFPSDI
jgi:hypothetical protein